MIINIKCFPQLKDSVTHLANTYPLDDDLHSG